MNIREKMARLSALEAARDKITDRKDADRREVERQQAEVGGQNAAKWQYLYGTAESPDGRDLTEVLDEARNAPDRAREPAEERLTYVGPAPVVQSSGDAVGATRARVQRRRAAVEAGRDDAAKLRHVRENRGEHIAVLADAGVRSNGLAHSYSEYYLSRAIEGRSA